MPEENEKIEDFISLWKKKIASEDKSSLIGDSINRIEDLQKENEKLKLQIAENLQLITKSEEMLKSVIQEKERLKLEKEETLTDINFKLNELELENSNLNHKVKSMEKLTLEKDELIKSLQSTHISINKGSEDANNILVEELKGELTKKKNQITALEQKIEQLQLENENVTKQMIEKMHSMPVDYVLPVNNYQDKTLKLLPSQGANIPLEILCQDLQTDLNKYKRIVEKLTEEKSQLKKSLEEKGFRFDISDLEKLKNENESLKRDLKNFQQNLEIKEIEISQSAMRQVEERIRDLETKLKERESIIADLKLNQPDQIQIQKGSMPGLIENLQNQISKLKILVKEKDQEISELNQQLKKVKK